MNKVAAYVDNARTGLVAGDTTSNPAKVVAAYDEYRKDFKQSLTEW